MNPSPVPNYVLELEHDNNVPLGAVFRAWTDAAEFKRWADLIRCEIDLRTGGAYLISHPTRDDAEDITGGRYIEIITDQRLKFTWNGSSPGGPTGETVVTLEFTPTKTGSHMHLRHEFHHEYSMHDCEWGWKDWLETLERYFEANS